MSAIYKNCQLLLTCTKKSNSSRNLAGHLWKEKGRASSFGLEAFFLRICSLSCLCLACLSCLQALQDSLSIIETVPLCSDIVQLLTNWQLAQSTARFQVYVNQPYTWALIFISSKPDNANSPVTYSN